MANPGQLYEPPKQKPSIQLNNNDYGRPMGKPLPRPETRPPIRADGGPTSNLARKKKFMVDQQGGGRVPPQQGGPTLDAQPTPAYPETAAGGVRVQPPGYGGNFGDGRSGMKPPQWGGGQGFAEGEPVPGGGGMLGFGMKDPRAGGLNKRTGVWTPPDPAYLEGLKNGTIEPEWKRRERMNQPISQGPGQGWKPQGGFIPWASNDPYTKPGGPVSSDGERPYNPQGGGRDDQAPPSYGDPVQRMPPQAGGQQGGGGRQPLRPGMEYRPGGGQRPVGGGGPRPFPQDGGQNQVQGNYENWLQQGGVDPRGPQADVLQSAADAYSQQGQDPNQMNAWRQKLMQMQKQGPMNNQFYGAF